MFCAKCGNEVKDGAKFCGKCGCAVPTAMVQTAPIEKRCTSCGTVLKDGVKFCPKCGGAVPADVSAVSPTPTTINRQAAVLPPQISEQKKKIKKLLLIASIVAPMIFIVISVIMMIGLARFGTDSGVENVDEISAIAPKVIVIQIVLQLLFLIISTMLNILGQRINSRKMILSAGIVYFVNFYSGIPSAVLCFIAFAKMKKQE
jgi:predicted  nucleic acid-binding Zn-ribbon protein